MNHNEVGTWDDLPFPSRVRGSEKDKALHQVTQ